MICVATKEGLSIIEKKQMTLAQKANYYREIAEKYCIRKDGYSLSRELKRCGVVDVNEGFVGTSDNDGLWTGIYLSTLCFEYAVTKDKKILEKFADTCGFDICIAFVDISFYLADFNLFEGKQRKHFCISANNHSG